MSRPASNRTWCVRWDELSNALARELSAADCDVARVTELVQERRRLTTAHPVLAPGDRPVPEDEQRRWLEASLAREGELARLAEEVRERVGRSLSSLDAGRAVRRCFETEGGPEPRVFSTRV